MASALAQEIPEQQSIAKNTITGSTTTRLLCFHAPPYALPILAVQREVAVLQGCLVFHYRAALILRSRFCITVSTSKSSYRFIRTTIYIQKYNEDFYSSFCRKCKSFRFDVSSYYWNDKITEENIIKTSNDGQLLNIFSDFSYSSKPIPFF